MKTHIPELPDEASIKPVLESLPKPFFSLVRADVVNKNGRSYTKACLERAVADMMPQINKRTLFVHELHRRDMHQIDLTTVVGMVKDAFFDGEQINIAVQYLDQNWAMVAQVMPMSFVMEASCSGFGSEIYEMKVHSILTCPRPIEHLL